MNVNSDFNGGKILVNNIHPHEQLSVIFLLLIIRFFSPRRDIFQVKFCASVSFNSSPSYMERGDSYVTDYFMKFSLPRSFSLYKRESIKI